VRQELIIQALPPGLNGSDGLKNMHYHEYSKRKKEWAWFVRAQNPKRHEGKVKVKFTRVSTRMMDYDNIGASFKFIGDALEGCKAIQNDSPEYLTELSLHWEKAKSQKQQYVKIEIEDV
jgi:hypothetical protein